MERARGHASPNGDRTSAESSCGLHGLQRAAPSELSMLLIHYLRLQKQINIEVECIRFLRLCILNLVADLEAVDAIPKEYFLEDIS